MEKDRLRKGKLCTGSALSLLSPFLSDWVSAIGVGVTGFVLKSKLRFRLSLATIIERIFPVKDSFFI